MLTMAFLLGAAAAVALVWVARRGGRREAREAAQAGGREQASQGWKPRLHSEPDHPLQRRASDGAGGEG